MHDKTIRPGRALRENDSLRDIIRIGIEVSVPGDRQGDVLVGKRGHGRIDDLFPGVDQFVGGISCREPTIDLGSRVRDVPIFAGRIRKTAPDNHDR